MNKQELKQNLELMMNLAVSGKRQEANKVRDFIIKQIGPMVEFWE